MRIVIVSSDRKIFEEDSAVRSRQIAYANRLGATDIIVFTLFKEGCTKSNISDLVTVYPTNSKNRWRYVIDAVRIGRSLGRPDIVTVQDPFESGLAGRFIASFFKTVLHVQVHTDITARAFREHSALNKIRSVLARFVLSSAGSIRVVAERIKIGLREQYRVSVPIVVLPIFAELKRFADARAPQELVRKYGHLDSVLVSVGRFEPEKNMALSIRVLKNVRENGINAVLLLIGDGSELGVLKQLAASLGVSEYLEFVGWVDPAPYYVLADMVLVPSKYEGYGMVIAEALSAGVPVLSRDIGAARELGAIISEYSEEAFIQKATMLLTENTPIQGELLRYPYRNEADYIDAYVQNITESL